MSDTEPCDRAGGFFINYWLDSRGVNAAHRRFYCHVAEVPQGSVHIPRSGFSPARQLAPCCLLGVPCARPRGVLPPCLAAQLGPPSSTLVQSKAFHPREREQIERDKRNARLPSRILPQANHFTAACHRIEKPRWIGCANAQGVRPALKLSKASECQSGGMLPAPVANKAMQITTRLLRPCQSDC